MTSVDGVDDYRLSMVLNSKGNAFPVTEAGIQAAINDLEGTSHELEGEVWIPRSTSITITTGLTIGKKTKLHGRGAQTTTLVLGADVDAITIDNATAIDSDWAVTDLEIDPNGHVGNGIYSSHACSTGENSRGCEIARVKIGHSGSMIDSTKAGISLTDFFRGNIHDVGIYSAGKGVFLGCDDTKGVDFGNGILQNVEVWPLANNAIAFHFQSGTTHVVNLLTVIGCHALGNNSYTGTVGFKLEGLSYSCFLKPETENMDYGMQLLKSAGKNAERNTIIAPMLNTCLSKGIYLTDNGCHRNVFVGGYVSCDTAGDKMLDDQTGDTSKINAFIGVSWYTTGTVDTNSGSYLIPEYQTSAGTKAGTTPTGPVFNGRGPFPVKCSDTNALFVYSNGGWHYVAVT
jgi:hypothetical protein